MEVRELGQLIRARRKERGYTQEAVASFVGCSTKFLSELERGKTTAEIGKVIPIIHILGMDLYVHRRGA
jgi:y4mF family transcriptional regulator